VAGSLPDEDHSVLSRPDPISWRRAVDSVGTAFRLCSPVAVLHVKDAIAMKFQSSRSALRVAAWAAAVAILTIASAANAADNDKGAAIGPPLVLRLYAAPGYPVISTTEQRSAAWGSAKANATKAAALDRARTTLAGLPPAVR
jgi:hypothetical protein